MGKVGKAMTSERTVRAAGVVLLRDDPDGRTVCVLHRPHQKDWSLPKGKLERGEHLVAAARRETLEETGLDVTLGVPLKTQSYRALGKPKVVNYWVGRVRPGGPGFAPNHEIDQLEWLTPRQAAKKLTYPRDADLVAEALKAPATSPLIILRHAQALSRRRWAKSKPDQLRPLAASGVTHSKALAPVLDAFGIRDISSSSATRCVETVKPYSAVSGLSIGLEHALSEEGFEEDRSHGLERVREMLQTPEPQVLSTHRPVLPAVIRELAKAAGINPSDAELDPHLPPGGFIILHRQFHPKKGLRVIAVERHAP